MATVNQVVDYIVVKVDEANASLNLLKLQKLLYYIQAWALATTGKPVFSNKFQAWVHGPVCREVYDRFRETHSLYDQVTVTDGIRASASDLDLATREHVDEVLEAYAGLSGSQLEAMTHREQPWIQARGNRNPAERCEVEIDERVMADFYAKLLNEANAEAAQANIAL